MSSPKPIVRTVKEVSSSIGVDYTLCPPAYTQILFPPEPGYASKKTGATLRIRYKSNCPRLSEVSSNVARSTIPLYRSLTVGSNRGDPRSR
jgi:hypothetical protein